MMNTTKKYKYEEIETGRTICADCGDEAETLWEETYGDHPSGRIRITNQETGYENILLPIKFN